MSVRDSSAARSLAIAICAPLVVTALKLTFWESLGRLPFLLYFASTLVATGSAARWRVC